MRIIDHMRKSTVFLLNKSFSLFGYNLIDTHNRKERFYLENGIEVVSIQNANFKTSILYLIIDAGSINGSKHTKD